VLNGEPGGEVDVLVLTMDGLAGDPAVPKVLQQSLTSDREALYGVRSIHFAHETPGQRRVRRTSNVTIAYLGGSLSSGDPTVVAAALEDLKTIKAESPAYPVVTILDAVSPEDDVTLRRLGFEPVTSAMLADDHSARAFVENKIIELRLGLAPPFVPEDLGVHARDATVLRALKHEFSGALPPPELWRAPPRARRNLVITFTYFARACRRLATREVEGRRSATAFVLTPRAIAVVRSFAEHGGTVFRFGRRELRVSLGGIHQKDVEDISRVSDWPGSFVVIDELAMIRGVVATPERVVRAGWSTQADVFTRLLEKRTEIGFLVPGDGTVRVYSGPEEVLRHDGFEWLRNNRPAVRTAFVRACSEVCVPERIASTVFDAALLLAESKRGCFVILGSARSAARVATSSVPLDPRLSVALETRAVVGASPLVLSTLAEQDGALIVDHRGSILGFGRLVRTRERPRDSATHGTKHATAAQLTRELKGVVTLVVSQDGPASVYYSGDLVARTQF
jgi:DNA integrity scanning protein DisA with diadenylate cyclase activity